MATSNLSEEGKRHEAGAAWGLGKQLGAVIRMSADSFDTENQPVGMMTYSHDGFGMGHLRRNTTIAVRFLRDVPGSNVLMLIGCPSGAISHLPEGLDFIKIPSIIKVDTGVWHPRTLRIGLRKIKAIRSAMIQKGAELFQPDLFLVDHTPTGVKGELLPTLQILKELKEPPAIVLGIRDILDFPRVIRAVWQKEGFYEVIDKYFDAVFIYGRREVFDTASQYGLDSEVEGKIRYCGYLCSEEPIRPREQMRDELEIAKDKLVLVTAGGGYDAYPMMSACVDAFRHLGADLPFDAIVITGPLMRREHQAALRKQAQDLDIRILTFVEDSLSYLNAADLIVTMGGYNSLSEALHLNKKALVIPRSGPSAEQEMRAKLFAERGLVDVIYNSEMAPQKLAKRVMADLERNDFPLRDDAICSDGTRQAVGMLVGLLRQAIPR